jgi:hypothetical protein
MKANLLLSLVLLLLLTGMTLEQGVVQAHAPQQAYDLSWWTVDGGGGTSNGTGYLLDGTAGQPDPGPILRGGSYHLAGGFWHGGAGGAARFRIYLPLVLRNG